MKLVALELEGFRGFARKQRFDLDANAIIVVGANGHGKTSLLDGILWSLSGQIPRLGTDPSDIISKFSETGEARASLTVRLPNQQECTIKRIFDGTDVTVVLDVGGSSLKGPSAEGKLIDILWPEAASAKDTKAAIAAVVTRSVYLQQDLVRSFIDGATDQERFNAVSELVGAGRVAELQIAVERAKVAWTKVTNSQQDELQTVKVQQSSLEARLAEITNRKSQTQSENLESAWNAWWEAGAQLGVERNDVHVGSREAPSIIDSAMKSLDGKRRALERHLQQVSSLRSDIVTLNDRPVAELSGLQEKVKALKGEAALIRQNVESEQKRLAETRRLQETLKEKHEQVRTLAKLALKQLDERCPVCDQDYSKDDTRRRLEALAADGTKSSISMSEPEVLPSLLLSLSEKEKEIATAEIAVRLAEQKNNERKILEQATERRFADLKIKTLETLGPIDAVDALIANTSGQIRALSDHEKTGESLALRLVEASDQAKLEELRREVAVVKEKVSASDRNLKERVMTGDLGQKIIESLREATSEVVSRRLSEIDPLLQAIYSRIDPHPAFRTVNFISEILRGRGHLHTAIRDPVSGCESNSPNTVLSSSQMNALAVSVFLALNLGVSRPPLSTAILDDPLQSLDDINLLGLVDLLRRTKDCRQLCVSTHDARLASLLTRKLRPAEGNQRTILIELEGWNRTGPTVKMRDIKGDTVPLRLAMS